MGTEVLRPQDCLAKRFHNSQETFHHGRKYSPVTGNNQSNQNIPNNYGYRKPTPDRTDPKRKFRPQEITIPTRIPTFDNFKVISKHTKNHSNQNNDFYNGKVSVLRRGASLDSINQKIKKDLSNNKIKNKAKTNTTTDLAFLESPTNFLFALPESTYAGSAFSLSPPPSDLPLPTFFKKQSFDNSATRDLRRLLRLE